MRRFIYLLPGLLLSAGLMAQKKPLDHAVYDGWQSIGERAISNNGKYVVYAVTPQEGDGTLYIQAADNSWKTAVARGYSATITEDSRFVVFKIRAPYKDTRDARIKKKTPNDMPKDSLGILELGKGDVTKIARVKSFKTPVKGTGQWVAYLLDKPVPETIRPARPDSATQLNNLLRMADSLARVADSLRNKANEAKTKGMAVLQGGPRREPGAGGNPGGIGGGAPVAGGARPAAAPAGRGGGGGGRFGGGMSTGASVVDGEEGTDLVLRNLQTGEERIFKLVSDYFFSEPGNSLVLRVTKANGNNQSAPALLWASLPGTKVDTVMKQFNDLKSISFDETGSQVAFVAERDSVAKALSKFYKLWHYKPGMDSAQVKVERTSVGVGKGLTVSENYFLTFSKDGSKLFFGLAQIKKPKDTTLVDFETARLDVWHYNDDYLQPQQLLQLNNDLRRSYTSVLHIGSGKVVQLGTDTTENIQLVNEGNADFVLATSSKGNRVEAQWQGFARQRAYLVSVADGTAKLVKDKQRGFYTVSPGGKFIMWYDMATKNYFTYEVSTGATKNITQKITAHLYDDEDDHPDDPSSFGTAGWLDGDAAVLINDRYDIWQVDPTGAKAPVNVTNGYGKKNKIVLRYVRLDTEKRTITPDEQALLEAFNRTNKYDGYYTKKLSAAGDPAVLTMGPYSHAMPRKAKNAEAYIVGRMNVQESNIFSSADMKSFTQLSATNPQQKEYNWLTSELVKWKMFDGKEAEGLLFKPEDFDPKKKYPVIFYFYEKNADLLYSYRAPAPSASTVNIAYFVSNGYLVFDPNIYYKNGEPGESAYNSVVSAAKHLAKMPWVDSTKMAIQGQSWGGYQVAYLVTRTKMFAAAGAGAPVANMTSAYGGIRWGTGLNRQFQYEHSQSRIGATLWQKPELYLKNSPLFKADKVTTPLLIMHNDADGAVPWYQGIEYFTALRRLGKKVWMLQYNGEDHNLVERRNRKDLSVRLAQFFDHYLKGAPAAKWITEGVPATDKGIDWGLSVEEKKGF